MASNQNQQATRSDEGSGSPKLFRTTVVGVGPFCVEFADGEIVWTRSEERQYLIAAAPELLAALQLVCDTYGFDSSTDSAIWKTAFAAIGKAEGSK